MLVFEKKYLSAPPLISTFNPVLPETLHLVPRLVLFVAPVLSPWVVPQRWVVPARVALLQELAFDVPWPPIPQDGQKQVST